MKSIVLLYRVLKYMSINLDSVSFVKYMSINLQLVRLPRFCQRYYLTLSTSSSSHQASSIAHALERFSRSEVPIFQYHGQVEVERAPGGNTNRTYTLKGGNLKAGVSEVMR